MKKKNKKKSGIKKNELQGEMTPLAVCVRKWNANMRKNFVRDKN